MCENLHDESVYFKELHNQQEYYCPTIYRMGAAVVSTITSIFCTGTKTNCTNVQIELQQIYIYQHFTGRGD